MLQENAKYSANWLNTRKFSDKIQKRTYKRKAGKGYEEDAVMVFRSNFGGFVGRM